MFILPACHPAASCCPERGAPHGVHMRWPSATGVAGSLIILLSIQPAYVLVQWQLDVWRSSRDRGTAARAPAPRHTSHAVPRSAPPPPPAESSAPPAIAPALAARVQRVPAANVSVVAAGPAAILLFAPHKTGSTFFTAFMHDLHEQLGMCWYTDSAAFMYHPKDYSKCSSPSCGHAGEEKAYSPDDRGWGDCTHFTSLRIREASECVAGAGGEQSAVSSGVISRADAADASQSGEGGAGASGSGGSGSGGSRQLSTAGSRQAFAGSSSCVGSHGVRHGLLWGPLRLPAAMNAARGLLPLQRLPPLAPIREPELVSDGGIANAALRQARRAVNTQLPPQRPPPLAPGAWQWLVVLHQRHPLDTLVSGYHSFGWTHPAAPGASEAQQRQHEERQAAVRNQSIDAYVLANAAELARKYKPYLELLREPPSPHTRVLRSRYEEMVTAFPRWLSTLLAALEGSRVPPERLQAAKAELLRAHAGTFKPDGKHKRSVLPGRYERELKPETTAAAIHQHQDMFSLLGYS